MFVRCLNISVNRYGHVRIKYMYIARMGIYAPALSGLGEIDGLFVPPGKASNLLTDHLITG